MLESPSDRWPSISEFLAEWLREPRLAEPEQAALDQYYRSYRTHFGRYLRHHYASQTSEATAMARQQGRRLLEVGAGCGTEALWFALQGASVTSIDIKADRLASARARKAFVEGRLGRTLDVEFRLQSLFDLDEPERFDIVWMEQTFHHLEPRKRVYGSVARALAPGGHLVVSEANAWNPLLQAQLFARRGFRTIVRKKLPDGGVLEYGNERIVVPAILASGFRRAGVEPVAIRYFRMLPNRPWADRLIDVERAVPAVLHPLLCTHYNFVGRKADE